jgi:hypothetical protein
MVQCIININYVKIKDIGLMRWIGVFYFLFILYYGTSCYIAAVVYLACECIMLGHECVGVLYAGVSNERFIQKLLILVFAPV